MPEPVNYNAASALDGNHLAKAPRRRNWFGLPVLRLTTLLPLALSTVVFVVTLSVAWLAANLADRQNTASLADKAQVFLDATAGHFSNSGSLTEAAVSEALTSALSFRTIMGEEALAVGWIDTGKFKIIANPQDATVALGEELARALETGNWGTFEVVDDFRGELTRVYGEGEGRLAITGVFNTAELTAVNETVHQAALGLSLFVALTTAFASYALARVSISPLVSFASRLAEGGTENSRMATSQYLSSEIVELETILALRRAGEKSREEMARRLAQLERDQVLARLAATLAHEVRNPLAGIRNAFSTLRRFGGDTSVREETLNIIEGGLDSLQRLTDVTLSTYRRRPGEGVITATDITDLALIISPQIKEKNLDLQWDIPETTTIVADADAVRQMLVNLLLNACKASPTKGRIRVSATPAPDGLRMSITDNGAGLPEGVRRHLQAGLAADASGSRELGLWVVHSLADELGARVAIESRVDQGTSVTVLFPNASASLAEGELNGR